MNYSIPSENSLEEELFNSPTLQNFLSDYGFSSTASASALASPLLSPSSQLWENNDNDTLPSDRTLWRKVAEFETYLSDMCEGDIVTAIKMNRQLHAFMLNNNNNENVNINQDDTMLILCTDSWNMIMRKYTNTCINDPLIHAMNYDHSNTRDWNVQEGNWVDRSYREELQFVLNDLELFMSKLVSKHKKAAIDISSKTNNRLIKIYNRLCPNSRVDVDVYDDSRDTEIVNNIKNFMTRFNSSGRRSLNLQQCYDTLWCAMSSDNIPVKFLYRRILRRSNQHGKDAATKGMYINES